MAANRARDSVPPGEITAVAADPSGRGHTDRRRLWIIAGIAVCWFSALAILALRTANPVVLNAEQIQRSDLVVLGTAATDGTVSVERSWKQPLPAGPIRIGDLPSSMEPRARYLIPLSRDRVDRYRVTRLRGAEGLPMIYPATPETVAALETQLARQNTPSR